MHCTFADFGSNKVASSSSSSSLVTIASTFFEMILLDVTEPFIVNCANQFGFKKKHSTEHCIYALKNVISYYNWFGSPVYRGSTGYMGCRALWEIVVSAE